MATSFLFRQSFQRTSRRARRLQVFMFCGALLASLLGAAWPAHWGAWTAALPILALYNLLSGGNPPSGGIMVTSLDDRSVLKYGAEYESLNAEQQADILSHYRVGNYLFPRPVTQGREYAPTAREVAHARRLLGLVLATAALLQGAAWHGLHHGDLPAWTGVAAFVMVAAVSLFSVPRVLQLWNQPE